MRLDEIAAATRGRLAGGRPAVSVSSISTDTRTLRPGELFVAIVGERFDGHAFVRDAFGRGAAAVVLEAGRLPIGSAYEPAVVVENTTRALQDVAGASRARSGCTVLAVTGSNGKTTTKEFIATLASPRFKTVKSESSFNNHIGVPLTLLRIDQTTELAVVEIGMSAPGEIRALAAVAQPQVGVITNVNPAHIEFFESIAPADPLGAIAEAKAELLEALPDDGTAVLNADDEWVRRIGERWHGRRVTYGTADEADVRLTTFHETEHGADVALRCFGSPELHATLPVPGKHNALNAVAAMAACCALGMDPEKMIETFAELRLPKMRFERHTWNGAVIINDAYNANPESMRAAFSTFTAMPIEGRRFVICGEMRELGAASVDAHRELGRVIAELGIDRLVSMGGHAHHTTEAAVEHGLAVERATDCPGIEEAAALLRRELKPGDAVLIKGSRANAMERIVEALLTSEQGRTNCTPTRT